MVDKFKLEIERGAGISHTIGISMPVTIDDGKGSSMSGSVLFIQKCDSYKRLEEEIFRVRENLESLLHKSKMIFEESDRKEEVANLDESLSPQEIWDVLSKINDPEMVVLQFNRMGESMRFKVADYVLANVNIFSGNGSLFSSRYNSEKGILE